MDAPADLATVIFSIDYYDLNLTCFDIIKSNR
jgi:hypothetical protein